MKRNKWMFISGLVLTIGGMFVMPAIGAVILALFGEGQLNRFFSENREYAPLGIMAAVAFVLLPPFIGMALLFGSFLIPYFFHLRSEEKILEQGQPAEAKILALNETGTLINHNPVVRLSLEVYSQIQPAFRAEVREVISIVHIPSFQPGKMIYVKYLPGTQKVAVVGAKIV